VSHSLELIELNPALRGKPANEGKNRDGRATIDQQCAPESGVGTLDAGVRALEFFTDHEHGGVPLR
jgi:hypothetical protein